MMNRLLQRTTAWQGGARSPRGVRFRILASLRALLFCTTVSVGFSALSIHRVYGEMRESGLWVGRELAGLRDVMGPAQPVVLNGATMLVGGRHVDMSVHDVLSRFAIYCQEHAGGYEHDFSLLTEEDRKSLPENLRDGSQMGIMRSEVDDEEGFLSCIAAPAGAEGLRSLMDRLEVFGATGDLGKVGNLRYVFARKNPRVGGSDVVTLRQEGPLNVMKMLFAEGDAPGEDNPVIPRPRGSVRTLAANVPGTGYALRAYETVANADQVLQGYEATLPALGWEKQDAPTTDGFAEVTSATRAFVRQGAAIFISAESEGDKTVVQVAEMGTRGAARVNATRSLSLGDDGEGAKP